MSTLTEDEKDTEMKRHYVTFMSPGTFVAETNTERVDAWDVKDAVKRANSIQQRHNARPYGFYFYTMERQPGQWEPKQTAKSPMHYLPHCKVRTLEQVQAEDNPQERILRANMEGNGWKRVVTTTTGWRWTQPLNDDDVVLT